jgi:hypothetical protein
MLRAAALVGQKDQGSSGVMFYMGIYAAISGLQMLVQMVNYVNSVTCGIRAGRSVIC